MLTHRQIRKMIRPYSDTQLAWQGNLKANQVAWSNGCICLFEPIPDHIQQQCVVERRTMQELLDSIQIAETQDLYPVAIGETSASTTRYHIYFSNSQGEYVMQANARYVSTILKKAGKQARNVTWQSLAISPQPALMASVLGRRLAIIAPVLESPVLWEWELINRDVPRQAFLVDWSALNGKATQPGLL